jgi:hypothetical protein
VCSRADVLSGNGEELAKLARADGELGDEVLGEAAAATQLEMGFLGSEPGRALEGLLAAPLGSA